MMLCDLCGDKEDSHNKMDGIDLPATGKLFFLCDGCQRKICLVLEHGGGLL